MAQKRMISNQIVDSDAFLDMPVSSQLLYFQFVMRADNEGFIGNPKKIMKIVGVSEDDLKILLAKRFVLTFDSGVIVIKHWKIHNAINLTKYQSTTYLAERNQLEVKENKAYTELTATAMQLPGTCHTKLNKIKLNKIKLNKYSEASSLTKKEEKRECGEFKNVLLTDDEFNKLVQSFGEKNTNIIIEELSSYIASKGKRYKNHYATLLGWARRKIEQHQNKLSNKGKEIMI